MFGFPFGFPPGNQGDDEFNQGQGENYQPDTQEVDNSQYYKVLGLDQNATQQQIKSSYQKLKKEQQSKQNGGDPQKLKQIEDVFQVLNDPIKRDIYNKFGKAGLQQGGNEEGGGFFDMFFGGGGKKNNNKTSQLPKVQATKKALEVTLQNLYNGQQMNINHARMRNCQKCSGKGGQNVKQCQQCNGQGMIMQMFQMGVGMYQQVQKKCDKCEGQGQIIGQGGKCQVCQGKKILQKQKNIQVNVQRGTPNNFAIKIQGEGNQIPGALPGDLYFITQQKQHETFTRIGADLYMKKNITLLQALTGFQFEIKHLDGTIYTIYSEEGEVVSDQMKKIVKGLGMPFYKKQKQFGNLIIQFHVVMPKRQQITKEQIIQLSALMPGEKNKRPQGQYQMFEDLDLQILNTNEQGGKKPQDQYDPEQQQGIQCGTQ